MKKIIKKDPNEIKIKVYTKEGWVARFIKKDEVKDISNYKDKFIITLKSKEKITIIEIPKNLK